MVDRYGRPVRYGRESAHKSGRPEYKTSLDHWTRTTPSGRWRRSRWTCTRSSAGPERRRRATSAGPERSQQLQILPSLTVRRLFCISANFCGRQCFPSPPIFCGRQCFPIPPIFLGTNVFQIRLYFWAPMFSKSAYILVYFTGAYIFSVYFTSAYIFVCANNLLAPIFWVYLG